MSGIVRDDQLSAVSVPALLGATNGEWIWADHRRQIDTEGGRVPTWPSACHNYPLTAFTPDGRADGTLLSAEMVLRI